jgi:HEAT repeat protein
MTMDRIEERTANGNHVLARKMIEGLWQATDNARENHRLGGLNWRLKIHKDSGKFALAQRQYERNKWLTYTDEEAREVFEALAADDSAGFYQQLARRELAKPANASDWTYLLELIFTDSQAMWQLDPKARSQMIRATTIHSGNWPMISALNILQENGVLADLVEDMTCLIAPWSGGYPGNPPPWRYTFVNEENPVPANWMDPDFDDSAWEKGRGPVGPNRKLGEEGLPGGRGVPYIRIEFDCERTDFKSVQFGIRTKGKTIVYLNGSPILWSDATLGPRMGTKSLAMVPLTPEAIDKLRVGRNVIAIKTGPGKAFADYAMYGSFEEPKLGWKPRPKDWSPGSPLSDPDTASKTPAYKPFKTVLAPCTTGLVFDPPGKLNTTVKDLRGDFIGVDDQPGTGETPLAARAKYMGHFDPRVRLMTSRSLLEEGKAAMPFIIEGLKSDDVRVIRSACDAIAGSFSMNGLGRDSSKGDMNSEVTGEAVPLLVPLVKHEDMYARAGALMALSKCGKAAAEHLDQIVPAADDEDWWVRSGVAYVLGSVTEPETGDFVDSTVENFLEEKSIYGKNRFREALTQMAKRGHGTDEIVAALVADSKSENAFDRSSALTALSGIGPNAKAGLPVLEAKLEEFRERLAAEEDPGKKKLLERDVAKWEGIVRKTRGEAEPPGKKPKNRKKQSVQ